MRQGSDRRTHIVHLSALSSTQCSFHVDTYETAGGMALFNGLDCKKMQVPIAANTNQGIYEAILKSSLVKFHFD